MFLNSLICFVFVNIAEVRSWSVRNGVLVLLLFCSINGPLRAQRPQGVFLSDSIDLGKPFQYALSIRHRSGVDVFFPDTAKNFSPFVVRDISVYPTRTNAAGSLDSAVYTLVSFETQSAQTLSVPILLARSTGDCTALRTIADTVFLRERILTSRPDTLRLATETRVRTLRQQMNYPLLFVIVAGVALLTGIVYLLFGKFIVVQYRLFRLYQRQREFERSYARLIRNLTPENASERAGKAVFIWKQHLEWLEKKPFTTMTTREVADSIKDPRLADALREADGIVYGGIFSEQTQAPLRVLCDMTVHSYHQRRRAVLDALRPPVDSPTEIPSYHA